MIVWRRLASLLRGKGLELRSALVATAKEAKSKPHPFYNKQRVILNGYSLHKGLIFSISFIKFLKFYSLKAVVARARDKSRHENSASLQTQLKFSGRKLFARKI